MGRPLQIALLDDDFRRRATISRLLSSLGKHVEPFESLAELSDHSGSAEFILVHDNGDTIARLVEALVGAGNWIPVVAFHEAPEPRRIVESVFNGALYYMTWPFEEADLAEAIEIAQDRAGSVGVVRQREAAARSRIARLSRREQQVLGAVVAGLQNRSIAEQLEISPRTVEIHRSNMLHKLGANTTSDAIRIAIEAAIEFA